MARIAFFGAGYAGLVSGACMAELGHTVVIRDIVPERIDALGRGEIPFYEPELEELIAVTATGSRFTLSMDEAAAGSEFLFVCVGTPPTHVRRRRPLRRSGRSSRRCPADLGPSVLVMKSTVPVGTGEKVRAALDARGLGHVGYASCPEFLAEGSAVRDFMQSDRVVVGSFEDADGDSVAALHERARRAGRADGRPLRGDGQARGERVPRDARSASSTRSRTSASWSAPTSSRSREGMGLDRRIGTHYLRAGLGYGGSCFPKDMSFLKLLAGNSGYHFHLVTAVMEVNELQMRRAGREAAEAPRPSAREADRAPRARLQAEHRRPARGAEPRARLAPPGRGRRGRRLGPGRRRDAASFAASTFADTVAEALRGADAAVVVTEWPELRDLAWAELRDTMRDAARRRRAQPSRRGGDAGRRLRLRGDGPGLVAVRVAARDAGAGAQAPQRVVEAIVLAGGKAERLGDAAGGRPKSLVDVAGRPLAAYQVGRLAGAGVDRVIVSCAAGQGALFMEALEWARRRDRLRRGAGAARPRRRDQVRGAAAAGGRRRASR